MVITGLKVGTGRGDGPGVGVEAVTEGLEVELEDG